MHAPPRLASFGFALGTLLTAATAQRPEPAFVPNVGQWDDAGRYRAAVGPAQVFLTDDGWRTRFADSAGGVVLAMRFAGGAVTAIEAERRLAGAHDYFLGADPQRWRTDVPRFGAVRYRNAYRDVDVLVYAREGLFEYDLELAPGADLRAVEIDVDGADSLRIDDDGAVTFTIGGRTVRQTPPASHTVAPDGARRPIHVTPELRGPRRFGFAAPAWDGTTPLVIDPGLVWSTYFGGTASDTPHAVAVDELGRTTVGGESASSDFPIVAGAYQPTTRGGNEVVLSRFDPRLAGPQQLLWSTFLGGFSSDIATDLAVDAAGVVTLVGATSSTNFPRTANAYDQVLGGQGDGFVVRYDPSLAGTARLVYASYFGGSAWDFAQCVRIGPTGLVTIFGGTQSTDLPTSPGAFATTFGGFTDDYVARFDLTLPPAQQLLYSTYFGGTDNEPGDGELVLDGPTRVAFAASTGSLDFPTTANALSTSRGGPLDATVTVLDLALAGSSQLVWSTYLGGSNYDFAKSIARGPGGLLYVAGTASSSNFPVTANAFSTVLNGAPFRPDGDAFACAIDPSLPIGAQLVWSTFVGATAYEQGRRIVVDSNGIATVMGLASPGPGLVFPTTPGAFATSLAPARQCTFVSRFDPARTGGAQLRYSTLLALGQDQMQDMALHDDGSLTLVGTTHSATYPTTPGAYQPAHTAGMQYDGIVTRLDLLPTGVTRYGTPSPGCAENPRIDVGSMPFAGNPAFEVLGSGVPPAAPGLLAFGTAGLTVPVVMLGAGIWVDPTTVLATPFVLADARGGASVPIGIPGGTAFVGVRFDAQFGWFVPASPAPCPPLGVAASPALTLVIQP